MKYIFMNLKNLFRKETFIFFIMILCVFVSSLVLNFSYGLYHNYEAEKLQNEQSLKEIVLEINKESAPTHQQVREFVESLSSDITEDSTFFFAGYLDAYEGESYDTLDSRFTYRDGKYALPEVYINNLKEYWYSGRLTTDEEENAGALVAMVGNSAEFGMDERTKSLGDGETYIELWGKRFEIVGESEACFNTPTIPFLAVPDDFVYDDIFWLTFDNYITRSVYEELQAKAEEYMPGALTFPELQLPDDDSVKLYNNMIVISIMVSILSALNLVVLFRYVLIKRNRPLSIFRLCGITRLRSIGYYLAECFIIAIPIYWVAVAVYQVLLKSTLSTWFPYITEGYSAKIYLVIFLLYCVVLCITMFVMLCARIQKSIVMQWKGETI